MSEPRVAYTSTSSVTPLTPAQCVAIGGHCWGLEDPFLLSFPDRPPERTCKHCGLRQRGVRQEPVRWEDVTP